jgi:hypothetical protein
LNLTDTFIETPGRKMTDETYWSVLKKVTTSLKVDEDAAVEKTTNGRSATEQVAVSVNHELMQNSPNPGEVLLEVQDNTEMDQLSWHQSLEAEDGTSADEIPVPNLNQDDNTEVNSPTTRSTIVMAENETVVEINQKKMTVRKATLNVMSLTDVVASGKKKMIELDIPAIRHRRKCRQKRELKALQDELNAYLADESGSSKFNWIMSTLEKDSSTSMYDNRLEYRLMKKGCWIAPPGPP